MNLKSLNVSLVALVGLGLLITMSAFTTKTENESKRLTYFYKYKLNTYSQSEIENPVNYERATSTCSTGIHVCGVLLDTDNGPASQPDVSEFDDVKGKLWASEQADLAAIPEIKMRN